MEQAVIKATNPAGFPVEISLSADSTKELLKRVGDVTEHLLDHGFKPPANTPQASAAAPVESSDSNGIKPGDDYTILAEPKHRHVRIFNPYKPDPEDIRALGHAFGDILGKSLKAELIKKPDSGKWGKAHWTIPIGYFDALIDHPHFAGYTIFRDEP